MKEDRLFYCNLLFISTRINISYRFPRIYYIFVITMLTFLIYLIHLIYFTLMLTIELYAC